MNFLQNILHPKDNIEEITSLLFKQFGVRVADTTVSQQLLSHPDYPSLSAISQVLSTYGIESVAIKTNDYAA